MCKTVAVVSSQYLLFTITKEMDVTLKLQFENHVYELIGVVCKDLDTNYCYTRRSTFSDFDQVPFKVKVVRGKHKSTLFSNKEQLIY